MKIRLPSLVFSLFCGLGLVANVMACSCLPSKTVVGAFQDSENVVVVSLQSTKKIGQIGDGSESFPILQHRMLVEKVYKGNLTQGQEIPVAEGSEGACGKSFRRERVGQKFLLFMGDARARERTSNSSKESVFGVSICSRSERIEDAEADLEYLDNRLALTGKTRLSGNISSNRDTGFSVEGIRITVSDSNLKRTATTNKKGFFEFWDLPPGKYRIEYKLPDGWQIKFARSATDTDWTNALDQVSIVPKGHSEVSAYVDIANQISGRIFSPDGLPMEGACVSAYWLTPTTNGFMIPRACADKNGEFKLTDLLAGDYRLEVGRGTITSTNPFEKFYYPGVEKKEDAQVISIGPGVQVKDLVIRVKKTIPLIKISGRLTFQDGRGFPEEPVRFDPANVFRHERVEVESDKDGNFEVILPEGCNRTYFR